MKHNCPCFGFLRGGPVLILVNFRGGPVLILELFSILVNFRVGPVLILELFSILVIFRVGPVKRNTLYDPYNWKLHKHLDQFNNSYFKSLKSEIWYLIIFVLLFRFYSNAPRVTERSAKKEFAAKSLFWKFKPTLKWIYKSISQFHPVFKSTHNSDKSMFSNPIYIKIGILI